MALFVLTIPLLLFSNALGLSGRLNLYLPLADSTSFKCMAKDFTTCFLNPFQAPFSIHFITESI